MSIWSRIKKVAKTVWNGIKHVVTHPWRALKALVRFVVKLVIEVIMRIINSLGQIFFFWVEKTLTLQVMILRDEGGNAVAMPTDLDAPITEARAIFKSRFNIKIKQWGKPLVQTIHGNAPKEALDVSCDGGAVEEEFTGASGEYFAANLAGWVVVPISVAFPITVVVVRSVSINGEVKLGCAIGVTDYATLSAQATGTKSLTTLAHELGHACSLLHRDGKNDTWNLMYPDDSRSTGVTGWQKFVVRTSRHCTFW